MIQVLQKAFAVYFFEKRFIHNIYSEMCFRVATSCHICYQPFLPDDSDKMRDHEHVTGEFRGAADNKCNLALRRSVESRSSTTSGTTIPTSSQKPSKCLVGRRSG